jgi:hypothetical protein
MQKVILSHGFAIGNSLMCLGRQKRRLGRDVVGMGDEVSEV